MSMKPQPIPPVPEETARIARAAFPKGTLYLRLRDELGAIYRDEDFAGLFPARGQPGLAPWRLALMTVMQFLENLSDRQAADAVRARIDWKYALSLELTDPGFDFSVLSEFRARLLERSQEMLLLDRMLERFRSGGLVKARGKQRTDSTHVLASVRVLNRLELLGETLRAALNHLATIAPGWLSSVLRPGWVERYGHRVEDSRLPKSKAARETYARLIGEDGYDLLDALSASGTPKAAKESPYVRTLRDVWSRHFERTPSGARLRDGPELARAAERMESPYEPDARFRSKSGMNWTGYMVHFSETCEEDQVHLITHVETTPESVHEAMCTETIHEGLAGKRLLPSEHLVDAAYVSGSLLVQSEQQHGITLLGPPRPNANWQARTPGGFRSDQFRVDWEHQRAICPQGTVSVRWKEGQRKNGDPFLSVRFGREDCLSCSARSRCTRSEKHPRQLFLQPREQHEALQATRERLSQEEGQKLYALRAGVEGTISQAVRAFGLRQARYRGLAKVHLEHVATAAAINLARVGAWKSGERPAKTRISRLQRLAA
jgi:transposase